MVDTVKNRRITKKDWKFIESYIKEEADRRQNHQFRRDHEVIWREVDRQLRMEALIRTNELGQAAKKSWHAAIELGELSKISEIVSADVMRITFPQERDWFEPHVELPVSTNPETGEMEIDEDMQAIVDGIIRSLMVQQHFDFGFFARFELSVKEALHHGSFVAEAVWDSELKVMDGSKVAQVASPVWMPHSMWNCFPDPSPAVIGTNMFYGGSMIIQSFMPKHKLKKMSGEGWMKSQYDKIPDDEHTEKGRLTKDLKLVTYHGDLNIERNGSEDIYLPNSKAVLANGVIVYWAPNELPYPSIIYGGYERQDVRDPYFTSPIIKQAPTAKIASILANKFLDSVSLKVEPPLVYDSGDPDFAESGGPAIYPGAKTGTKGGVAFQQVEIGDPKWALEGLQLTLRQLQEGTGVSSVRTGVPNSDRQTATEVNKVEQGGEVRTVDFIRKLVPNLRTFLHMHHALNLKHMKNYSFYNDNMDSPDFVRLTSKDLKEMESVRFDVVGAKGVLGEEQRLQRTTQVTAFASADPGFAPLLKRRELLVDAYKDAGHKNPEKYVQTEDVQEDPRLAEMEQMIQQLQQQLQEASSDKELKIAELEQKREKAMMDAELAKEKMETSNQLEKLSLAQDYQLEIIRIRKDIEVEEEKRKIEMMKMLKEMEDKSNEVVGRLDEAAKPKNKKIKFIDEDTAEIESEDGNVVVVNFPKEAA